VDATPKRAVILLIGDGMGQGQVDTASLYGHGERGALFLQQLPIATLSASASISGTTDSAASATTMATGARPWNGAIGVDRADVPVETLVELAHAEGLAAGLVTTTELTHATPAAFSAHESSRGSATAIAEDQVRQTRPEVMLGGGMGYYRPAGPGSYRDDAGLLADLAAGDYAIVETEAELFAVAPAPHGRLFGAFAQSHLDYVRERPPQSTQPSLVEMSRVALDHLEAHPRGFFLMIEGGRIDHAGHANRVDLAIAETLMFDETVRAVVGWADAHPELEVTIVVTADHETGGLAVVEDTARGLVPPVTWRWGSHTNGLVPLYARGVRAEPLAGDVRDHAWVHAVLAAAVRDVPFTPPPVTLLPDGRTSELRHLAAEQAIAAPLGLDALRLDADRGGLAIGIDGRFAWDSGAIVVLLDVDPGQGTGLPGLDGAISDTSGVADLVLASAPLGPFAQTGFGFDKAIVVRGGDDPSIEQLPDSSGFRSLGVPSELIARGIATNFYDGVRTRGTSLGANPGHGWEAYLPWEVLYGGPPPVGASVAVTVVLLDTSGTSLTDQALPAFPAGTEAPGTTTTPIPGVISFQVDSNGDGVPDGDAAPIFVGP
jgi:alkaline phosphatase